MNFKRRQKLSQNPFPLKLCCRLSGTKRNSKNSVLELLLTFSNNFGFLLFRGFEEVSIESFKLLVTSPTHQLEIKANLSNKNLHQLMFEALGNHILENGLNSPLARLCSESGKCFLLHSALGVVEKSSLCCLSLQILDWLEVTLC